MNTRWSYVDKPIYITLNIMAPYIFFVQISQNIDLSDKTIQKAFIIRKTLFKQNLLEKCSIFTIYQNYTLALICTVQPQRNARAI